MSVLGQNSRRTSSLVFVLAFSLRGAFILTQQDGFYFPDSLQYSQAALNLLAFGELGANYNRAPAYPVFLAGVYVLFGESIFAVRVVESVVGAVLAVVIGAIGRRIAGPAVGALAGVIWAVYPMGIFIAGLVYPTTLAAMLLACGVWRLLPGNNEKLSARKVFCGGLFFGLAALTIPVALLTIAIVAAWVFYWACHSRILLACLLLSGSAVSLLPWTARNFGVYGEIVPVQPRLERHLPKIGTPGTNRTGNRVRAILLRPDLYAVRVGKNFLRFWELYPNRIKMSQQEYRDKLNTKDPRVVKDTIYTPNQLINAVSILSTGPVLVFGLIGTIAMWLRKDLRRELSLLWFTALSFAVGYSFFVGRIRYRIPVEPYLIILSAYGIHGTYLAIVTHFKSWAPRGMVMPHRSQ